MLFVPRGSNDFSTTASYAAATRPLNTTATVGFGKGIVPSITNAYSAYVAMGSRLGHDSYGMLVNLNGYFAGAANRLGAVSIGVDYTGGSTYTEIVSGALMSMSNNWGISGTGAGAGGITYYFPLFIPSGSQVGMAARGNSATPPVSASIVYMQKPPNPHTIRRGSFVETLGVSLGNGTCTGITVNAGQPGEGNWTIIGTTQKRTWHIQAGVQLSGDTTMNPAVLFLDIGVGDGSIERTNVVASNIYVATTGTEQFTIVPNLIGVECNIAPGSSIWARLHNSIANTDNAGAYQVVVYATGG